MSEGPPLWLLVTDLARPVSVADVGGQGHNHWLVVRGRFEGEYEIASHCTFWASSVHPFLPSLHLALKEGLERDRRDT